MCHMSDLIIEWAVKTVVFRFFKKIYTINEMLKKSTQEKEYIINICMILSIRSNAIYSHAIKYNF